MDQERKLPEVLAEALDPVQGNPYPQKHPAHNTWVEATRRAEYEISRINAAAHSSLTPENAGDWMQMLAVAKFDVWARRGVQVVWSDEVVGQYDRWLVSYANAWIDSVSSLLTSRTPPFEPDVLLADLRRRLAERVDYWKAEARRYRLQQEEHLVAAASAAPPEARRQPPSPALLSRRRSALRKYRDAHRMTVAAAARKIGISETGINGIVREDWKRFNRETQQKLLTAIGLTVEEWYRE